LQAKFAPTPPTAEFWRSAMNRFEYFKFFYKQLGDSSWNSLYKLTSPAIVATAPGLLYPNWFCPGINIEIQGEV